MKIALLNEWFLKYSAEQAVGLRDSGADVTVVRRDHLQEFAGGCGEWRERDSSALEVVTPSDMREAMGRAARLRQQPRDTADEMSDLYATALTDLAVVRGTD